MRNRTILFVVAILLACRNADLHAVLLVLKNNDQIYGFLVEQSDSRVTIREATAEGKGRVRHFSRDEIATLLVPAEPDRLAALSRDNPKEYRNFAEELAEPAKRDPEARETAIRLYLIAAYLDTKNLGKSSLLGMINLARTPREERNFRALAYLLDPESDARLLRRPEEAELRPDDIDPAVRGRLVNALKALRRGQLTIARNFANDPRVKDLFDRFQETLPYATFDDAVKTGEVSPSLLQRIVTIELALMGEPDDAAESPQSRDQPPDWANIIRNNTPEPVPSLTLETVTEFDPSFCHFRDGKWIKP